LKTAKLAEESLKTTSRTNDPYIDTIYTNE